MIVYLLTGLISFLGLRNYENVDTGSKKCDNYCKIFYKYFTIILLSLVFGLRDYGVGTDTKNYLEIFNWLGTNFIWERFIYEKGFCILSVLVNKLFDNFTVFLIICGFIIYFNIIQVFCKMSQIPSISVLCYFGIGLFAQSCNALRQYLAISFCLVALYYLIKKDNNILFVFYVIIAFLFHKTAIFFLILLPIKRIEFNLKNCCLVSAVSVIAIPIIPYLIKIFDSIFNTGYFGYFSKYSFLSILNVSIFILSLIGLFISMHYKKTLHKQRKLAKEYDMFLKMLLIFCILILYSITFLELLDRVALYFLVSILFIVPIVLKKMKTYKLKFLEAVMIVCFIIFIYYFLKIRGTYGVIPYTFVNLY